MKKNPTLFRADQLLARFGFCSRREAPSWVKKGRVTVNGEVVLDPTKRVDASQAQVDGADVEFPNGVLVAFHKPLDCVCTHDEGEVTTIYDILPSTWIGRIPPVTSVGRLDKDTSGLLLITDDGDLVHRWTSPKRHVEKVYEVETEQDFPENIVEQFASGTLFLRGEEKPCLPSKFEITSPRTGKISVVEGRYHQVRRMFASQSCTVVKLHRIKVGALELGDLAEGEWRVITTADVDAPVA